MQDFAVALSRLLLSYLILITHPIQHAYGSLTTTPRSSTTLRSLLPHLLAPFSSPYERDEVCIPQLGS